MDAERWQRLKQVFPRLLRLDPARRGPLLEQACAGDAELQAELRSLLQAHEQAGGFLEEATYSLATALPAQASAVVAGPGLRMAGPYRLQRRLGRGGMGVVYRAHHVRTGRTVALKTLAAPDAEARQALRREVHALARLNHPGIVRILDEGLDDGLPWYAMELLQGRTLRQLARARRPATAQRLRRLLRIAQRLCAPLAFLHGEGLVHRDLKPENVFVRKDGSVVLMDFGLCSTWPLAGLAADEPALRAPLQAGQAPASRESLRVPLGLAGTVPYMAPEQVRGELLDARADLYSLGCILYELGTGRVPFQGGDAARTLRAHLHEPVRRPAELAPELDAALEALILALLAKQRAQRPGHAQLVADALAGLLDDGARRTERGARHRERERAPLAQAASARRVQRAAGDEPALDAAGSQGATLPEPRAYLYRPALAGRADTLARLRSRLERLTRSEGGILLLQGESGVGKTRLALELAREARSRGMLVLTGECAPPAPGEAQAPLQGLRGALRAIADACLEGGRHVSEAVVGPRGPLLALYESGFARLPGQPAPAPVPELPPEAARLRLLVSLSETFTALAARQPVLLVLDDLHWADGLSLALLHFWLHTQRLRRHRMLVLGTFRGEEAAAPLLGLVERLDEPPLPLQRLDEAAVRCIVGDMLALAEPPEALCRHLAHHSEGNPLFVAELLRLAVQEQALCRDRRGRWRGAQSGEPRPDLFERLGWPRSLQELLRRRLDGLDADARRLLEAAAVLGREPHPELLGLLAGLDETRHFAASDELTRRQVLEKQGPEAWHRDAAGDGASLAPCLRFSHEKLRETAYAGLDPQRRLHLHRQAAEALEAGAGGKRRGLATVTGQHWEAAGVPQRAREWYAQAASEAAAAFAHDEAERSWRAALRLFPQPRPESVRLRIRLAARALAHQGRNREAAIELEAAWLEARSLDAAGLEVQVLTELGSRLRVIGELKAARQRLGTALRLARRAEDRAAEGWVWRNLASLYTARGELPSARLAWRKAVRLARRAGDARLEADALMGLATDDLEQGRWAQGRAGLEQVLGLFEALGDGFARMTVLRNLATERRERGQLEESGELYRKALKLAQQTGERRMEGILCGDLGDLALIEGRLDEGRSRFAEAAGILAEVGDRRWEGLVRAHLGLLEQRRGDLAAARRCLQRALQLHRETGEKRSEGEVLVELADVLRQGEGGLDEAQRLLDEADTLLEALDARPLRLLAACCRGHLALAQGRDADEPLRQAASVAAELGIADTSWYGQGLRRLERAVQAFRQGRPLQRGECVEELPEALRGAHA